MSVVIIVNGGGGRAALRRLEAANGPSPDPNGEQGQVGTGVGYATYLNPEQVDAINCKIDELTALADDLNCPPDPER